MRQLWLRGLENITKRSLIHVSGFRSSIHNLLELCYRGQELRRVFIHQRKHGAEDMAKTSKKHTYPTALTDAQWQQIEPLFSNTRTYKWSKRELTNAVLDLVDSGCKWRQLPHDFPPYSTMHSFYRRARITGLWNAILQHLNIWSR